MSKKERQKNKVETDLIIELNEQCKIKDEAIAGLLDIIDSQKNAIGCFCKITLPIAVVKSMIDAGVYNHSNNCKKATNFLKDI